MRKFSLKLVWEALKDAFKGFGNDKVPKLSASLAYYTVFSIGPLLICIIFLSSMFFGQEAVEGSIYGQIRGFVGSEAAAQLQEMIKNATLTETGSISAIIGIVALLIGATTMFAELQDSINMIWGLKPKPTTGIMKTILNRLLSFGVIGSLVFLLLVSLAASALISGLGDRLKDVFPEVTVILFEIINWLLTVIVTTILFSVIFKVLPDAKIRWRDILPGALATTLLFLLGKFLISFYISKSEVGSTYGAAGSFVILLLWVYYSSIILYFGAEFTKAYAFDKGARIRPNHYVEWDEHDKSLPPQLKANQRLTPEKINRQESRTPKQVRNPIMHQAASFPRPESKKKRKKGPGMGTILFGLLIYFFKTSGKKKSA